MREWKETDYGNIPMDWDIKTVDEIKSKEKKALISGPFGSNISAKYFVEKGVPVIRGNNLSLDLSKKFNDSGFVFITNEKAIELGTWAEKNDLIFTAVGTIGQVGILTGKEDFKKYIISNKQIRLKVDENIVHPLYAYYWFASPIITDIILQRNTGSSVPLINLSVLKSLLIPTPSKKEQLSILKVLSSIDAKIDLLHRQNATLEAMAETLFRQWFVEEAKEDWEDATLDKHTEVFRGLSYKGSGLAEHGIGLPMHNLNSVYEGGGYKYEGIKFYTGDYRERHLIEVGDIIVTNTEQGHDLKLIGFPAIVPNTYGNKGLFSQHIYKLSPLTDTFLSKEFIYYLLMTPSVREQITAATNGSTVNMLAIDGLQRPEFKLPPKEKVIEFTIIVSNYWKKKNINQTQIRTLTNLRDTLLPKLMSGEVRVAF